MIWSRTFLYHHYDAVHNLYEYDFASRAQCDGWMENKFALSRAPKVQSESMRRDPWDISIWDFPISITREGWSDWNDDEEEMNSWVSVSGGGGGMSSNTRINPHSTLTINWRIGRWCFYLYPLTVIAIDKKYQIITIKRNDNYLGCLHQGKCV